MIRSRVWTVAAAVLIALGASSCSSPHRAALGTRVVVVEHDFGISATPDPVPPGFVTLHVENNGPSTHELILDRTSVDSDALPLRPNGLQVNEDDRSLTLVSSLDQILVGTTRNLTVWLIPGHYVLFCNLEGHYLGGMSRAIEVKE